MHTSCPLYSFAHYAMYNHESVVAALIHGDSLLAQILEPASRIAPTLDDIAS